MTIANPPSLAAERKMVTVLFADISGFTAMSEQNEAEVVRERINTCFSRLAPVVKKHSGTIEKYIGDEIMAIFGAPIMHENDADLAALAALEMMEALSIYNQEFGTDLGIHMGINTGAVIAGGIGAQDDLQYGVLGDTVNVAARLADAAERGQIFVGENTSRLIAAGFQLKSLDPIRMRGKSSPVAVSLLQGVKEKPSRKRGSRRVWADLAGGGASRRGRPAGRGGKTPLYWAGRHRGDHWRSRLGQNPLDHGDGAEYPSAILDGEVASPEILNRDNPELRANDQLLAFHGNLTPVCWDQRSKTAG